MPTIRPFAGIRYDAARVGGLADVVAPPYDVIAPEEEERLRGRSPHNIVRLDLPRSEDGDRYEAAGGRFARWKADGVLTRDPDPRIYVYEQRFDLEGEPHVVHGMMAAVGLEPLGEGILPHEETLVGPREDRLKLMRATRANLSPIYGIYSDPSRAQASVLEDVARGEPLGRVTDESGVTHTLWATSDRFQVDTLASSLGAHPIFIADGHHRYKTALTYQEECRAGEARGAAGTAAARACDFILMFLVNVDDKELVTLPVHRLVRNLPDPDVGRLLPRLREHFDVEDLGAIDAAGLASRVARSSGGRTCFGLYAGAAASRHLLELKGEADPERLIADPHSPEWKRLAVTVLHRLLIERALGVDRANVENQRDVAFVKSADEAFRRVDSGEFQLAVITAPTPARAVQTIARLGEIMPQKSTYFYPKPLTGLVINPLD